LVGDGPQRQDLENFANQLHLSEIVKLIKRQSDVRPFLATADIKMLTSQNKKSSNSVLEYISINLPSIVSNIPANRKLLNEVLFQPGNPTNLTEKLYHL